MNRNYVAGLLTGFGAGAAGIWFASGQNASAAIAVAVALVGGAIKVFAVEQKEARRGG